MVRRRCARLFLGLLLALEGFDILMAFPESTPLDPGDGLRPVDMETCLERSSSNVSWAYWRDAAGRPVKLAPRKDGIILMAAGWR